MATQYENTLQVDILQSSCQDVDDVRHPHLSSTRDGRMGILPEVLSDDNGL